MMYAMSGGFGKTSKVSGRYHWGNEGEPDAGRLPQDPKRVSSSAFVVISLYHIVESLVLTLKERGSKCLESSCSWWATSTLQVR